ncbi:hypothetical protein Tco_1300040, partial [Tanacetum coccineum]
RLRFLVDSCEVLKQLKKENKNSNILRDINSLGNILFTRTWADMIKLGRIALDDDDDVLDVLSFGAKVLGLVVQYSVSKYWIWRIEGLWWIWRIYFHGYGSTFELVIYKMIKDMEVRFDMIMRQKAVFDCVRALHAHDFLLAIAINMLGQHMSQVEYLTILNYHFMIPLFLVDAIGFVFRKACLDSFEEHAVHCKDLPGFETLLLGTFFLTYVGVSGSSSRKKHL